MLWLLLITAFSTALPDKATAYADNCWEWVMYRLETLVPMVDIIAEDRQPYARDIAVIYYEKSGLTHYAVVEWTKDQLLLISECNMYHLYPTGCGYRFITKDYKNLQGFYTPTSLNK